MSRDWDEIDDLLAKIQQHQYHRTDAESLARVRSDLAELRYTTRLQLLQQTYSRGRA